MSIAALAPTPLELLRDEIRATEQERALRGSDYRSFHRRLRGLEPFNPVRMTLLGNVTCELLEPFLAVSSAKEGFQLSCRYGGFGQFFQDLDTDLCKQFDPQIVFLLLSLEQLRSEAMGALTALSPGERLKLREQITDEIRNWVVAAQAASNATLLVANFPMPSFPAFGVADSANDYGETEFYYDLNRSLLTLASEHPRLQIFDLAGMLARVGSGQGLDRRMYHVAKVGWTDRLMAEMGRCVARHLIASTGTARKCLVLDADNTLWGGVLGEDGPWGIKIDKGDATGEAFLAFQRRVRSLKDRGVLLALCSKNNLAEMDELFEQRTDMPLQRGDFAAFAVGWNSKSQGLMTIACDLNIGLNALVFIDDNPAEIAHVKTVLPMVETVLLPDDVASYEDLLDRLPWFEKSRLTLEDSRKSDQYAEAAAREAALAELPKGMGYLESLDIELELRRAEPRDLPRLHQLFTKTNQFNVTTIRYSLGELEAMIADGDAWFRVALMRDRFGDMGMIAAILLKREGPASWRLDSFVMSCRAMGRGAETAILNRVQNRFARIGGDVCLTAQYWPTSRNAPAATLFADHGFDLTGEGEDGHMRYAWYTHDGPVLAPSWIKIREDAFV